MVGTRFWIKQNRVHEFINVSGFRDAVGGSEEISKTVVKRNIVEYRLEVPEEDVEAAFQFCFRQVQSGSMLAFWIACEAE